MTKSVRTAAMLLKDTLAIRERSSKDTLAIREKSIIEATGLLKKTSDIRNKREEWFKETGMAYNVFETAGISEKEVWMCNVLVDLLDPKGKHYQGNVYLELFKDMVVKLPRLEKAEKLDISKARARKQSLTPEGKLIDIAISDGLVFVPIEAKINTDDSPEQLNNYAKQSDRMNKAFGFIPVLFLTKDGHISTKGAPRKKYEPISFKEHIIPWLEACLEETKEGAAPVREIIKQYIKAIKSFC